ncbi:MAG: hypothetical protein WBP41_17595 [Saprospiraceae bacterium]
MADSPVEPPLPIALVVIDNNMKILKWVLLSVCVLKVVSFTLCLIFNPNTKEIRQFFEKELSRKYNEHSFDIGLIGGASDQYDIISRDSTNKYLRNQDEDKWPELTRTRLQDYSRYLNSIDPSWKKSPDIDLKCYPIILRNTVAEEAAKREVLAHFKNLPHQIDDFNQTHLIGLLTGINAYSDSMQVMLVPFGFESQLQFDYCKCDSQNISEKNNPFYYIGSLFNWKCTFQHPITKEIQVYDLKTVE